MDKNDPKTTVFSGTERAAVRWITLPDELTEWVSQNRELIERIQNALAHTYDTLTDDQIWEAIASAASPEWEGAWKNLLSAELHWQTLHNPVNTPLGLIGSALDSHETNTANERINDFMAHFTAIDEGLRQREDLSRLLRVLLVQKRMLECSQAQAQITRKDTAALAALDSGRETQKPENSVKPAFRQKAARKPAHSSFAKAVMEVFRPRKRESKTAPVPSSIKT